MKDHDDDEEIEDSIALGLRRRGIFLLIQLITRFPSMFSYKLLYDDSSC